MMSQTHILLAAAVFAKPGQNLRNTAVIAGAIAPDIAIFGLLVWSKMKGLPERTVWDELYWQEPWQTYTAAGNSAPLYAVLALLGILVLRAVPNAHRIGLVLLFFALAALLHIVTDLPVHVEDAHRHLWPLSDWKFVSPISYWDPRYYGMEFAVFEAVLGLVLATVLYRRFKSMPVRVIILTFVIAYLAVPAYFTLAMQ